MVAQATPLAALAPKIAIKAPATEVGIAALEEMTARVSGGLKRVQ